MHGMTHWSSNSLSTINNISTSVNNSHLISVFLKQGSHPNPGPDKKGAGSSSYILIHLFLNFSNTSPSSNVSLFITQIIILT